MKRTGRGGHSAPGAPPAPNCECCGVEMSPASATEWKCTNPHCPENGKKKFTGVYPAGGTTQ